MAQELGAGAAGSAAASKGGRRNRLWKVGMIVGALAVLTGIGLIVGPLIAVMIRGNTDQTALQGWNNGGSNALRGSVGSAANAGHTACGSSSPSDYALLRFDAPASQHYAGVAGDGTWDLLNSRSMVHYSGTPAPGQQGNSIIAFHREPDYQYIDQLAVGDTITVQDRACKSYTYKVTGRWDLPPSRVTQLGPTSGYDMTLVTCDPWWQDYNRLVWRLSLMSPPAASSGGGPSTPTPGVPSNPSF